VSEEKEEEEEKGSSERQIYYVACPFNLYFVDAVDTVHSATPYRSRRAGVDCAVLPFHSQ
jgi:hypothetical protein